jgi:hypothetical protein
MDPTEARLDAAEQLLAGHRVVVPPAARVRVAAALRRPAAPRVTWTHALAATAVAAVVLAVRAPALLAPPPPLAAEAPTRLAPGAVTPVGPARVALSPAARVEVDEPGPRTALRVWQGDLHVSVPVLRAEQSMAVLTRHARISAVGNLACLAGRCPADVTGSGAGGAVPPGPGSAGRSACDFTVSADEEATELEVRSGEVWVEAAGAPPRAVGPGRRLRIGARRAPPAPVVMAEAPAAPEPAPVGAARAAARPVAPPRDVQADLRDARRILPHDADRAAALAQGVIEARPDGEVQVAALLVLADAHRRALRRAAAAEAYQRLLHHPDGAGFQEEARFQLALLYRDLGQPDAAVAQLESAHLAHPGGPLAPERAALWAGLRLLAGDPAGAAAVLEGAPRTGWSRALAERRVEVAQAILPSSPERAAALVAPILADGRASDLRAAAEAVARASRKFEGQPAGR